MNHHKGFAAVTAIVAVLGLVVLGGVGYVALNPEVLQAPEEGTATQETNGEAAPGEQRASIVSGEGSISWRLESIGEIEGTPYTRVTAVVDGVAYEIDRFPGSCNQVGVEGGIDSNGLLAGELSAVQCWYAGTGDEIGVFAHEDGGYQIMVGELSEREPGESMFRGDFEIRTDIQP